MIKLVLYNTFAGSLTVTPDARGQEDFDQTLKRSEATDGVVHEYSLDLQFVKQSKAYLRDVFDLGGGIEAVVTVGIYEYKPNAFRWEEVGAGTIKFTNSDISDLDYKTSIEQTGFQRKVLNLFENDVDLETTTSQGGRSLPATPFVELTLHSKSIVKETRSTPSEVSTGEDEDDEEIPGEYQQLDVFEHSNLPGLQTTYRERIVYGQIDTSKAEINELTDSFALNWGYLDIGTQMGINGPASVAQYKTYLETNLTPRINMAALTEAGVMDAIIKLKLKHEIIASDISGDVDVCGTAALGTVEIHAWYERRDSDNNILEIEHIGEFNMPDCGSRTDGNISTGTFEELNFSALDLDVNVGDKFYVYETVRVYGNYDNDGIGDESVQHHFRITAETGQFISLKVQTVTPPSTAKSFLIFEAFTKTFQYYTDQPDCFRSDYFNRTDSAIPAAVDGPGSKRVVVSGANIRKVPGKTTFVNGKDLFEALNAIDCLGMGFELRDGKQVVVIEPLRYFYNKDSLIQDLGVVSELHRIVDSKQYASSFESNYGKIDIQKTNGIDEFATLRRWNLPITQVSKKQLASTKYKVSGYEIEDQRRKISSTEDSKNDDNNFFIDLVRDGETFKPRRTEEFTLVENLIDAETSYNLKLSPRRNADNWLQVLAISLYKSPTKEITFASGEGNYFMVTQMVGETAPKPEGGLGVKIDLSAVAPLYQPERYTFKCKFTSDQMALARLNPYGYFRFQEYNGGPDLEGYLSRVTREAKKNLGTFELIKVYR